MGPLHALLLLLATSTPDPHCFVPEDQTAGWKRVTLPAEAPALSAPEDLDQFRSGEPVRLYEQDSSLYAGSTERPGRKTYHFAVPADARGLEVDFFEDLQGAKVEAEAAVDGARLTLLSERRLGGSSLTLNWRVPGVSMVWVTVHHHLRSTPSVRTWRVTRVLKPGEDARIAEFFRAPRSLYYLHPGGGRQVVLCDAPWRQQHLTRWPDRQAGVEVTLPHP